MENYIYNSKKKSEDDIMDEHTINSSSTNVFDAYLIKKKNDEMNKRINDQINKEINDEINKYIDKEINEETDYYISQYVNYQINEEIDDNLHEQVNAYLSSYIKDYVRSCLKKFESECTDNVDKYITKYYYRNYKRLKNLANIKNVSPEEILADEIAKIIYEGASETSFKTPSENIIKKPFDNKGEVVACLTITKYIDNCEVTIKIFFFEDK